jgi:hypothetical protein
LTPKLQANWELVLEVVLDLHRHKVGNPISFFACLSTLHGSLSKRLLVFVEWHFHPFDDRQAGCNSKFCAPERQ